MSRKNGNATGTEQIILRAKKYVNNNEKATNVAGKTFYGFYEYEQTVVWETVAKKKHKMPDTGKWHNLYKGIQTQPQVGHNTSLMRTNYYGN